MYDKAKKYFEGLKGKHIAVLGLGISHRPLINMLADYGADITVCDKRDENKFPCELLSKLKNMGIKLRLGNDYLKGLDHELIFKTPGIRFDLPELIEAKTNGSEIISEMGLFFDLCPCPIIGVTGSDGKTTTTTLIYELLKKDGYTCHLGGNIGKPLLPEIDKISEKDICIVELSSFQLHTMKSSPHISVVTNVAPNHLDMHKSMDEYVDAKRNIYKYQKANDRLIVNADNDITKEFAKDAHGDVCYFGRKNIDGEGVYLIGSNIIAHFDGKEQVIMKREDIAIPGIHNVENYLAAIGAVRGLVDIESIVYVANNFSGVPHRIELVRELNGVKYYNDSIASSPTRTTAGLRSFSQKVILIAGGYDKKIPFDDFGAEVLKAVKVLILMGHTKEKIGKAVKCAKGYEKSDIEIVSASNFDDAVNIAKQKAKDGDIVLMSPACASFDMFSNFEERGERFREIVNNF